MTDSLQKDPSILSLLSQLGKNLGQQSFEIVDHWEADLCAIGLSRVGSPHQLAYISTYQLPSGQFSLELEVPKDSEEAADYSVAGAWERLSYEQLRAKIVEHLGIEASDTSVP